MWQNRTRPNKTAKLPYAYIPSKDDPLVLIPDPEVVRWVEDALDHLDQGHSSRRVAAWLGEKTGKTISHQGITNIWKEHRGPASDKPSKLLKEREKARKKAAPKGREAKKIAATKRKQSDAKRVLTMSSKKLAKLEGTDAKPKTVSDDLDFNAVQQVAQNQTVVFEPLPGPQTEFLAAPEREVLFGGAAGGSKTYSLIADPLRYFSNGNFNGLLLRRTNDELREIVWATQKLYPQAYPGAKFSAKASQWTFPSGARLWLTYLERPEDVLRYQGQAFCWIGWDELTQYPSSFGFDYMRSRLRTTDPSLPLCIRATSNPGGPGHGWVKRTFIDPAPPNTPFAARNIDTGEEMVFPEDHPNAGQPLFMRKFIPSKLSDNPYLAKDGVYEANLLSLPENQRRQLLEGDWAVATGAAFPEFRTSIHTCEPFEVPPDWKRFRSCDFGYSSFSAVHWFAIDPNWGTLYVYRELYLSKHTGRDLAKAIIRAEEGDKVPYGILDSSCWHQRGMSGPSIAEEMIREGLRWRPSDRSAGARVAGKNRLHEVLKVDEYTDRPGLIIFNTCRQILADLPVIPSDPRGSDDIDPRYASDHSYDSLRYGVMSREQANSPFNERKAEPAYRPADAIFGY